MIDRRTHIFTDDHTYGHTDVRTDTNCIEIKKFLTYVTAVWPDIRYSSGYLAFTGYPAQH